MKINSFTFKQDSLENVRVNCIFKNQSSSKTNSCNMTLVVSTSMAKYLSTSSQPVESSHSILSKN